MASARQQEPDPGGTDRDRDRDAPDPGGSPPDKPRAKPKPKPKAKPPAAAAACSSRTPLKSLLHNFLNHVETLEAKKNEGENTYEKEFMVREAGFCLDVLREISISIFYI